MPDILTPTTSATAARYSYYLVDIVSNTTLAQIPFEDVSYERSLKQAGQFTGKITTTGQTENLDLYNSTMPGKTALYVMRNDKCVWGGIVWSRGYDMTGRSLTVSASEFTSYFNRRHIWKTYTYSFTAELFKSSKADKVKVTLKGKTLRVPFALTDGAGNKTKIFVSFSDPNLVKYSGYYNMSDFDDPTQTTFYLDMPTLPGSASAYDSVTISARVDTYDYVRELLKDIAIDFSDVEFTNETITPGIKQQTDITQRICTSNEVTVTTLDKHEFVAGQVVDIKNLEKAYNGKYKVTSVSTPYEFKYSIPVYNIKFVRRTDNIATVFVDTSGGTNIVKIPVGASIVVAAVTDTSFNGTFVVTATTDNSFTYTDAGTTKVKTADTGSITVPDVGAGGSVLTPKNFRVNSRKIQSTGPKGVTHVIRESGKVTMWTKTNHGFKRADKVDISIKVTSSDTTDVYAGLNNNQIPVVVTSFTSRSFSYYQDEFSAVKNDIKNKDGSRVELKTTKKNTAKLATQVKKLILNTVDTQTYEVGDYVYVNGVDGYDWTTPLYNGYQTIEELDTDSATIRNRSRTANKVATIFTADNHGYDVGDMVVITGMADATFNGTFKITSVSDPANAADGVAFFKFKSDSATVVTKAGSNSDYGIANTYGDSWIAFGMPEYGTVKEPDDTISLSKRSFQKTGLIVKMATSKRHGFAVGDKVKINIDADKNEVYEGVFTVHTVPREDIFTYKLSADAEKLPTKDFNFQEVGGSVLRIQSKVGYYPRVTSGISRVGRRANIATIKSDNHNFIVGDDLTISMTSGTYASFQNNEETLKVSEVLDDDHFTYASVDATETGKTTVDRKERATNGTLVTLRTTTTHNYAVGETVYVSGVDSKLNGSYVITANTANTFQYNTATSGTIANVAVTGGSPFAYSTIPATGDAYIDYAPAGRAEVVTYAEKSGTATTLTIPDHSYKVGDYVVVFIYTVAKAPFNNNNEPVKITGTTANTISYTATSAVSVGGAVVNGRVSYAAQVEKRPVVVGRTYGEFPNNSDLGGLDFSDSSYSNNSYQNSIIRGSDLTNVAQLLETYSNTTNGFDYRIDCDVDFDIYGNKIFKRTFVLVPRTPETLSDYLSNLPDGKLPTGVYAPPSAFGADKYVFEYPGNVSNFNMSENSSDSATRMFVVGSNDDFGGEGNARFAAASATDLLNAGWPILDKSERQEWPLIGINVVNVDNWGNYDAELDFHKTAERYLNESKPPMGDFIVTINGSLNPIVGTYDPGDWCSLRINDAFFKSRLASILEPRKDVVVRKIDTIKVNVPNNPAFPEQIDLTLVPEWQVDAIGK